MLPTKQKSAWRSNQSLNFVVKLLKTYVSPNPPNSGGMERNPLSLLLPTLMRHLWQPHVPTPHNYSLFLLFLLLNNFQSYRPLFIIFFLLFTFCLDQIYQSHAKCKLLDIHFWLSQIYESHAKCKLLDVHL